MNSRRDFFRQLIGQIVILREEMHGIENIPLNRLKELPENIIEEIQPVFFPEEQWYLKDKTIHIPESKPSQNNEIELNDTELKAFGCFKKGIKLKEIAIEIKKGSDMPFSDIYKMVTSLFFKLASLRICHPMEVIHIDEILKANK